MTDSDAGHPMLDQALSILDQWPNLSAAVATLADEYGDKYLEATEAHLVRLDTATAGTPDGFDEAVYGYIEMTIDTLRLQADYYRTGVFSSEASEYELGLHDDDDLMLGRYLPGLYLAQVFWPNHYKKHEYFSQNYLPLIQPGQSVLDVGTGPGTFGFKCRSKTERVILNDLSAHSRTFVNSLVTDPSNAPDFMVGSFLDVDLPTPFDHVIFSEVVEHLPVPADGMDRLHKIMAADGTAFFSTATNAAFYDHTIIFETEEEVDEMLDEHGFVALDKQLVVATKGPEGRDVVDINAIIKKR